MTIQVIIPTIRDAERSVSSVRLQTYKDYELTVVDTPNIGPGAARNVAAKESCSEWIAFLDDDDTWKPWYLETMMNYAEDADVMFASPYSPMVLSQEGIRNLLYSGFNICYGSGLVVRRDLFDRIGGFDEKTWLSEVWLFCLNAFKSGARIVSVPGILWNRTCHNKQLSISVDLEVIRRERAELFCSIQDSDHRVMGDKWPTTPTATVSTEKP